MPEPGDDFVLHVSRSVDEKCSGGAQSAFGTRVEGLGVPDCGQEGENVGGMMQDVRSEHAFDS
jgi:hypothetical protein